LVVAHVRKVHADLHREGIGEAQIEAVRDGMRRVVADGTGKRAQINGVNVAGKTGTAQFWRGDIKDNHAWFIAFAPYEVPKFALCVMVQGAKSGGGVSAPIAQRILEQCLALDGGYDPGFTALPPATGSFAQIDAVDYRRAPNSISVAPTGSGTPGSVPVGTPVPFEESVDPETFDRADDAPRAIPVEPQRLRHPDIRSAADPRGRILSHSFSTPAPGVGPDRSDVLKPFFNPQR
jgi:penicillin-binding protein 2